MELIIGLVENLDLWSVGKILNHPNFESFTNKLLYNLLLVLNYFYFVLS